MDIIFDHWGAWATLLLCVGGGLYIMKSIRQESSSFLDESFEVSFPPLSIPAPRWWSIKSSDENGIEFYRADTNYDWYARFSYFDGYADESLPDLLSKKIDLEELDYDRDDVAIETDPRVLFRNAQTQAYFPEVIRVEGKASQHIEERVYFDMYLFRARDKKGYFVCESRSSVLNGLVEGPFFEECLSELRIKA